tara:strand:- start:120 stop:548 length:429 start_codon:yes stop_codon:yes gene_type:complete
LDSDKNAKHASRHQVQDFSVGYQANQTESPTLVLLDADKKVKKFNHQFNQTSVKLKTPNRSETQSKTLKRVIPLRPILTATATKQASNPLRAYYHSKTAIQPMAHSSKALLSAPQALQEEQHPLGHINPFPDMNALAHDGPI